MSRFNNTDYSAKSGNNNDSSGDYKERDSFLMSNYAIIEATLDSVGVYKGSWAQNLILNFDDINVHEGVVSQRLDDEKLKVFGWDKWFDRDDETMELQPLPGQEKVSEEALPAVESTKAGGDTYRYNIEQGVMDGTDEPMSVGDGDLWLDNSKKSRTFAEVLSERGHSIINDDNKQEDFDWLNAENEAEFALRDELQGRRILFWFEEVTIPAEEFEGEDEDVSYTDAVILDANTEVGITIKNEAGSGESDDSNADTSEDTSDNTSDNMENGSNGSKSDFPGEVQQLVDMFARTGQDNRESVASMVEDAAPDGYEVNMDNVMAAIEAEA